MSPDLPLPSQLRGNEHGTFTHHSIAVRLPEIASRLVNENKELSPRSCDAVDELITAIGTGVIAPLAGAGPYRAEWDEYVAPHIGQSWLDVPWFFAEYYFYRRLLDAVDYWNTGLDPYRVQKELGLEQALPAAREHLAAIDAAYATGVSTDFLMIELTDAAIWGNQVDLSMWPTTRSGSATPEQHADRLLIDQRPAAIRALADRVPPPIDIVLDNVGAELIADLLVADLLLRSDLASLVRLHAKRYPVFVSDAMPEDVTESIDRLAADGDRHLRSAGERLLAEAGIGRLQVTQHPYWVSPVEWRERPAEVSSALADSGLVIVKGDANYRRLLGDRHWPFTTPFSAAIGSTPAPLLALRTLKSEIVVGLDEEAIAATASTDPEWLQNGRWALAAYATN